MSSHVFQLYICASAGEPMISVRSVDVVHGYGITGDRYALGTGKFSNGTKPKIRHVTLIALEDIRDANSNRRKNRKFTFAETRRNIITTGVNLPGLLGKEFTVGPVRLLGIEPCHPCDRPSELSHKRGFREAFAGMGGLRAEVLVGGTIRQGDVIIVPAEGERSCPQD